LFSLFIKNKKCYNLNIFDKGANQMRIKLIKILSVLILASVPQFILAILSALFFPSLWWVSFFICAIVASIIHEPVCKWWDKNLDLIPK
jgi:hypothetical protein